MMRRATIAAVVVAVLLIAAKLAAWIATGSVALLSTLVDSALDLIASILNLVAVSQALTPADNEHRFGHGKAEPLAGLGQSAFIAGSALFVIGEAAKHLFDVQPVENSMIGIAVMVLSLVLTFSLVTFQRLVVRKTGSLAVRADATHYLGDFLMSGAVIIALFVQRALGWAILDPLLAIAIALSLIWSAWRISKQSLDLLMDRELPDDDRQKIVALAQSHPQVRNVHDLRTRSAGHDAFIQFHLELDPAITLAQAHVISDAVEETIRAAFPSAEVIIHQDPAGVVEERPEFA
ncbi:MAG TPA: cation diffusion facilitator family transporter [Magnetospirillaceae bacterium]|jgi:ferrous-iron efflux pump FieF